MNRHFRRKLVLVAVAVIVASACRGPFTGTDNSTTQTLGSLGI